VSLADLLIQRILQDDIATVIPALRGKVLGEEDGVFYDAASGKVVVVEDVPRTEGDLRALLCRILPPQLETVIDDVCEILLK
jgi:hypothetical protein